MRWRIAWAVEVIVLVGCGLGCGDDHSIQAYQAAKDDPNTAAPASDALPSAVSGASGQMKWTLPEGWKELPPENMEYARVAVSAGSPQTVLTVVPLGGVAGGLLPNVQRWEGQLKLPASTEADLPQLLSHVETAGGAADIVDLSQPPASAGTEGPKRIVAAIIAHEDRTWFIKLMGPASGVAEQKSNFDSFVRSIEFATAAPASPMSASRTPVAPPADAGSTALKSYQAPPDWQVAPTNTPFRVMTFHVASGSSQGEVVISKLPAEGTGSLLANVNRWRGQAGLAPVQDEKSITSEPARVGTRDGMLFDFAGPTADGPSKRMLVAMIRVGSENWFFKMTGPADLVAGQRNAFVAFLGSVQFSGE